LTNEKILVVEDDEVLCDVIDWRLSKLGYSVCAKAATGEDAIIFTNEHKPDVILMDISLKGKIDGIDAATHIKKDSNIPIIFLTAHSDETVLERIVPLMPVQYIIKPFTDDDLRIALRLSLG
jgi:two-component system, response regulator PdtaR